LSFPNIIFFAKNAELRAFAYTPSGRSKITAKQENNMLMLKQQIDKMVKMYKNGCALNVIASTFDVSEGIVRKTLRKGGIERPTFKRVTETQRKEMAKLYKKGISVNELSEKFGYTGTTIRNALKMSGIIFKLKSDISAEKAKQIVNMYNNGDSTYVIAWNMSLAAHIVRTVLKKNNVKMRDAEAQRLNLKHRRIW
jgi:lambda repressor-like predicted transcriptional regulator